MTFFFEAPTPADIYRQLTEGPGTASLSSSQDIAKNEQVVEEQRAGQILALGDLIKTGWQGNAGDGAYGATVPLALVAELSAEKLAVSDNLISRQIDSFSYAMNNVRPVTPLPQNPLNDMIPFETDYDREVKAYQADAQHNIAIYGEYDNASQYNETNLPQEFGANSGRLAEVSVAPPRDTIEVKEPEPDGPEGSGGPDNHSGPSSGPAPGSTDDPGSSERPRGSSGGQTTTPNEWRPPVTEPGDPSSSRPQQQPNVGHPAPVAAVPGGFVGPGQLGGGPGGSGSGSGGQHGGRGGAAGGGPGGGPGAGGRTMGPGPGVGAGALAAEEAAARRAAHGVSGRSAIAPFGAPMGGGRGKDDDVEHERKILVEADGEEIFGVDTLTAPQVIGDEEYED
jgi:hypothetical protein